MFKINLFLSGIVFALYYACMHTGGGKILIVDDEGFCRISSALLETAGYRIETVAYPATNTEKLLSRLNQNIGLIITSFRNDDSCLISFNLIQPV